MTFSQAWFDEGVARGHAYLIVWCDTYDNSDYPAFHDTEAEARADMATDGQNMKRLMEVYDLRKPKGPQISQFRCMALSKRAKRAPRVSELPPDVREIEIE